MLFFVKYFKFKLCNAVRILLYFDDDYTPSFECRVPRVGRKALVLSAKIDSVFIKLEIQKTNYLSNYVKLLI